MLDLSGALDLSQHIGTLTGRQIGLAGIDALNETIDRTFDLARSRMIAGINLSDDYLRRKMTVAHATPEKPQASITAVGTQTPLSQFGATQLVRPVNWSNERILGMGIRFGKWPGWTQRKGAPSVGIQVNQKGAGRSVEVSRGSRKPISYAFSIPGKTDNDGNLLMFTRDQVTGKLDTRLGPGVYQLFGYQLKLLEPDIDDDLAATIFAKIDAAIAAVFQ